MSKSTGNIITLSIKVLGELHEIRFAPTLESYNKYVNDISMTDKVVPSVKYLKRVVVDEDKAVLEPLLNLPSVAISLVGELNEEYTGDIEVEVKK
ncbi:putative phage tail assembly chaperone [Vibrio algicola]|uniref:Phage protein n=1 Tax=Vibrio algicola TaxID=2662262 RepID=A0A5Q0TD90_9VIBR|nr:putative phage tail assembly chaperone [Vibrio algicola]